MKASERLALYGDEDKLIADAIRILARRLRTPGHLCDSPTTVRNLLYLQMADREHEEFHVLFLDTRNRLIADDCMFIGTLTQTSVYPREVAKRALHYNAAAVLLAHNHPSGAAEPSEADIRLTRALTEVLKMLDVKVLDHFIVGGTTVLSMAETGQL